VPDTPREGGFGVPAEFEPHKRTLVAWPARRDLWGDQLRGAKAEYAQVVREIARFEPVTLVANVGEGEEAATACTGGSVHAVDVIEEPIDDSWIRDNGPIFMIGHDGRRAAVDFGFNAWGEKYDPYDADAALARRLCERFGWPRFDAPFVLEGGAFTTDGSGTLVTTEQCLLNPNRNPGWSRTDVERALQEWLGVERVVWLRAGLVEDVDTDGHVDNVCAFLGLGRALVQGVDDASHPDASILAGNRARLEKAGIETHVVDVLPSAVVGRRRVVVPPLNCYFVNGGLLVPVVADTAPAETALAAIAGAVPDREVLGVAASVLAYGGGGIHCITQQVPA
jgi:agmatine deiminase